MAGCWHQFGTAGRGRCLLDADHRDVTTSCGCRATDCAAGLPWSPRGGDRVCVSGIAPRRSRAPNLRTGWQSEAEYCADIGGHRKVASSTLRLIFCGCRARSLHPAYAERGDRGDRPSPAGGRTRSPDQCRVTDSGSRATGIVLLRPAAMLLRCWRRLMLSSSPIAARTDGRYSPTILRNELTFLSAGARR